MNVTTITKISENTERFNMFPTKYAGRALMPIWPAIAGMRLPWWAWLTMRARSPNRAGAVRECVRRSIVVRSWFVGSRIRSATWHLPHEMPGFYHKLAG